MEEIEFLLGRYLPQIPLLIVGAVGLVFAVIRWRRHPRVSLLAVIGLVIFAGRALIVPYASFLALREASSVTDVGLRQGIIGVVSALVGAGAWIPILVAIFIFRRAKGGSGSSPA